MEKAPLDHPTPTRAHRVYATLTNHCNRECPWCSTCSSPAGSAWLGADPLFAKLPKTGAFELQLEGGEPTLHPEFWEIVERARNHPRCTRVVLCTNGVVLPRRRERLLLWIARLGAPLTLKLSINHYLLDRDPGLVQLALDAREVLRELGGAGAGGALLVLNVRLRRGVEDDDRRVLDAVRAAGLEADANVFYLQRYGFASGEREWELPFLVGTNFSIINPDGVVFGPDLVARAEAMRMLR
jgi:hypothetical protein